MNKSLQIDTIDNDAKPDKLMNYLLYTETKIFLIDCIIEIDVNKGTEVILFFEVGCQDWYYLNRYGD